MKQMLLLVWWLVCCVFPKAQDIVWKNGTTVLAIGDKVSLLEDRKGTVAIAQVSAAPFLQQFRPSTQQILHFGFSEAVHWIHFSLENNTREGLVLEVAQAFLPTADLYVKDVLGNWSVHKSGYQISLNQKKVKHHFQIFSLPNGRNEFYLRLISYTHPLPLNIWNTEAFEIKANKQKIFYGIYVGILLFVIAVNIFLFVSFQRFYYLHYAFLVFLYLATAAAVMEGFVLYLFPKTDLMFWYTTIPALNMPVLLSYCISFLEVKKYSLKLYKIAFIICIYFSLYLFWMLLLPLTVVLLVNQIHAFLLFICVTVIGGVVWKRGNWLGLYFAAAYVIWLFLVAIEAVYIQFGKPAYFFGVSHVSVAVFIEVFLLAYLLLKRFEWERKKAQAVHFEMERNLHKIQQQFEQEILQAKLEIQETTLNNISQEIHDNVGQILSLAKMQVSIMEYAQALDKGKLQELKENLIKALGDLRDMAKSLSGERMHKIGLIASLEQEVHRINKSAVLDASITISGETPKLSEQKQLLIFRIVQEVFQNVLKHADAKKVQVVLNFYPHKAELQIEDDGKGFNVDETVSTGLGLQNIRSRASLIGGDAQIMSVVNKGTSIKLIVPYDKNV